MQVCINCSFTLACTLGINAGARGVCARARKLHRCKDYRSVLALPVLATVEEVSFNVRPRPRNARSQVRIPFPSPDAGRSARVMTKREDKQIAQVAPRSAGHQRYAAACQLCAVSVCSARSMFSLQRPHVELAPPFTYPKKVTPHWTLHGRRRSY